MDILSEYKLLLCTLEEKLDTLMSNGFARDMRLKEVLVDEIQDVKLAITCMERHERDFVGYRPRRETLLSRPDFYQTIL